MMKTTMMMNTKKSQFLGALIPALVSAAALLALPTSVHAAPGDTVGTVTHLSGLLSVQRADGSTRLLSLQSPLLEGDVLATQADSFARIKFVDQSEMVIRPDSQLKIAEFSYRELEPQGDRIRFELLKGGFRAVTGKLGQRNHAAVSYETPQGAIKPLGTHLGALFCANDCGGVPTPTGKTPDNGLHVDVAAGAVVVTPKLTVALPGASSVPATPPSQGGAPGSSNAAGTSVPGDRSAAAVRPSPTTPVGGVSPTLPSTPQLPSLAPGSGAPAVVLNAGQFGYLPPPQNGVQPPLVLVPPSQAVQVRMPASISQNRPSSGATNKSSDPECVVQ